MKVLRAVLVLGVDVLGWAAVLVLGAGWGVFGCLTAGPDITWVALEGRLLDRGLICSTAYRQVILTQSADQSVSVSEL